MITKNFMRYLNIMGSLVENRYYDFKTTIIDILGEKNVIAMPRVYCGDDSITNFLMSGLHDTSLRDVSSGSSSDCVGTGLFLGSGGGTSPTADDYKLGNIIEYSDDGLAVISTNLVSSYNENNLYIFTFTCKNKSTDDITINESGLITKFKFRNLNMSNPVFFLWARNTFDPIVMKPGETRAFTMEITL